MKIIKRFFWLLIIILLIIGWTISSLPLIINGVVKNMIKKSWNP
jgi:hypothetical protein